MANMDFFIYYIIMGQKNKNTTYIFKLISNHEQKMAKYFANMDFKIYYYVAIYLFFYIYYKLCKKRPQCIANNEFFKCMILSYSKKYIFKKKKISTCLFNKIMSNVNLLSRNTIIYQQQQVFKILGDRTDINKLQKRLHR